MSQNTTVTDRAIDAVSDALTDQGLTVMHNGRGGRQVVNRAVAMDAPPQIGSENGNARLPLDGETGTSAVRPTPRRSVAGEGPLSLMREGWPSLAKPWDTTQVPSERDFSGDDFVADPALDQLGRALIAGHKGYLSGLRPFRIAYRWKRKGGGNGDHPTLGKCAKLSGITKHALKADFLVWIAADHLKELDCRNWHLEALLFHQLLHAGADEEGRPVVVDHDFAGFRDELRVYGPWSTDLMLAREEFAQLTLWSESSWGPLGSTVPVMGAAA